MKKKAARKVRRPKQVSKPREDPPAQVQGAERSARRG